jgi:hypothetical protein
MYPLSVRHLLTPVPIAIFSWNKTDVPSHIELLRQSAYSVLLKEQTVDQRNDVCESLKKDADIVLSYAVELAKIFVSPSQQPIRREYPLCVRWYFPGEPGRASMNSALPGFEVLCVLAAAAVLYFRGSCTSDGDEIALSCAQTLDMAIGFQTGLFSIAQWNRLKRQMLPVQLMSGWLASFSKLLIHCKTLNTARSSTLCKMSFFRAAERTASDLMASRREAMCMETMTTPIQRSALQDEYDQSHEHWAQLLCEGATADAEMAFRHEATHAYVNGLLKIAQWANNALTTSHASNSLIERWKDIASINSASCAEHIVDIDTVMQWRLESLPYAKRFCANL